MTTIMPAILLKAVRPADDRAPLEARSVSVWFGKRKVLDRVSLFMPAGSGTGLIGFSGCGNSTFLRILNQMHQLIPSGTLAGDTLLGGPDMYDSRWKLTDACRAIGMVFRQPNPRFGNTGGLLPTDPVALGAYKFAARALAASRRGRHLSWVVLAGIRHIESNHVGDGRLDVFGNTRGLILSPRLNGPRGMAVITETDTDDSQLDRDPVWDRLIGRMQFIPSSWRTYGVDGNGHGVTNPPDIYDATIETRMCPGADLVDPTQVQPTVFRYNTSETHVDVVLLGAQAYLTGAVPTSSALGPVPPETDGNGGRVIPDGRVLAAPASSLNSFRWRRRLTRRHRVGLHPRQRRDSRRRGTGPRRRPLHLHTPAATLAVTTSQVVEPSPQLSLPPVTTTPARKSTSPSAGWPTTTTPVAPTTSLPPTGP